MFLFWNHNICKSIFGKKKF